MDAPDIDFAAEGLLDGLEGGARAERLALLEQLAGEGLPLSELARTTASGTIVYLAADRVIVGPERYTAAEVAERSGVDEAFLLEGRRAMGLPIPDAGRAGVHRGGARDRAHDPHRPRRGHLRRGSARSAARAQPGSLAGGGEHARAAR